MTPLDDEDFEAAYDLIAAAIDRAGPEGETLFLSRLCLLLAHHAGGLTDIASAIAAAECAAAHGRGSPE